MNLPDFYDTIYYIDQPKANGQEITMGMTLTTLHFYDLDRAKLEAALAPSDLIRDLNVPWLSVLPINDSPIDDMNRLIKLAKRMTKTNDAAGLLFYYFDDTSFFCSLYRKGKKVAECKSIEFTWSRFGKTLNTLLGDEIAGKAFRYVSHCQSLEEQWILLEEAVGTALYDLQQQEPRRVERRDTIVQEIKKRDTAMRKRPDRFVLKELPREEWPETAKSKEAFYEALHPQADHYDLSRHFFPLIGHNISIPGQKNLLAYSYSDKVHHRDRLVFYNTQTRAITDRELPRGTYCDVIWITPEGNPVILFLHILKENIERNSWGRSSGKGFVLSLGKDGCELWRFEPDLEEYHLNHAHTSKEGILTLYTTHGTTVIWQIDGRTGKVLRIRRIPKEHHLVDLHYVDTLNAFVYATRDPKELIILDNNLGETKRWPDYPGFQYIGKNNLCGSMLWDHNMFINPRSVCLFNLQDGSCERIWLELPAFVHAMLPDGLFLATNEKMNSVIIFEKNGQVAARFSLKGFFREVFSEDGRTYVAEERGLHSSGLYAVSDSGETTIHLWRLDPVAKTVSE